MLISPWMWESYKDGEMEWKPTSSNLFLKSLIATLWKLPAYTGSQDNKKLHAVFYLLK